MAFFMEEKPSSWRFVVTFLGLSDLQLGDEKGTLNHLDLIISFIQASITQTLDRKHSEKSTKRGGLGSILTLEVCVKVTRLMHVYVGGIHVT